MLFKVNPTLLLSDMFFIIASITIQSPSELSVIDDALHDPLRPPRCIYPEIHSLSIAAVAVQLATSLLCCLYRSQKMTVTITLSKSRNRTKYRCGNQCNFMHPKQ